MKIFIDAGHNYSGVGTGAVGNGLKEQEITFYISDKLKSLLIAAGHEVKMSRNKMKDNLGKTLSEGLNLRAKMANEWGADLFVSIHCNAFNGKARGTEVLVYSLKSKSVDTAKKIKDAIVKNLGTIDRGVKERPDLCVLRKTSMPALLVETAFIDNVAKFDYNSLYPSIILTWDISDEKDNYRLYALRVAEDHKALNRYDALVPHEGNLLQNPGEGLVDWDVVPANNWTWTFDGEKIILNHMCATRMVFVLLKVKH